MTSAQPDYANDPDLQAGGDWWKWETINDTLTGLVSGYRKSPARPKADGSTVFNGVYDITKDDGDVVSLEVGQVFLKGLFKENLVSIGDRVRIIYVGDEKIAGKASSMKKFTLEIQKAGTFTPTVATPNTVTTNNDPALAVLQDKLGAVPVATDKPPF